jgi:hypothetical protein
MSKLISSLSEIRIAGTLCQMVVTAFFFLYVRNKMFIILGARYTRKYEGHMHMPRA